MRNKLEKIAKKFRDEIKVYQLTLKDKRTPLMGKIVLGLAVGYFFSPIDLIPDFIPVFGQLDDLFVVPVLFLIALKLIPKEVITEARTRIYKKKVD